jgi:hypothetical protein
MQMAQAQLNLWASPDGIPFPIKAIMSATLAGITSAELGQIQSANFAMGGHTTGPTLARVGELGPETVMLPGGASVIPNRLSNGGGGRLYGEFDREKMIVWTKEGNNHHSFRRPG